LTSPLVTSASFSLDYKTGASLNRLKNMTKTEYKDINEAPEENNFIFSVLINTPPNIQQNAFKG